VKRGALVAGPAEQHQRCVYVQCVVKEDSLAQGRLTGSAEPVQNDQYGPVRRLFDRVIEKKAKKLETNLVVIGNSARSALSP
jgi:hypothetical protein